MTSKRQIRQYTETAMAEALTKIRDGMGLNKASRQYGVPRGTLQDRLKGRVPEGPRRMGPNPYITTLEEEKLVDWCTKLAKCGFQRKQSDIVNTVKAIISREKRQTPFKNGRPGKKWFASFLKRNPQLAEEFPKRKDRTKARATINEEYITNWFKELEEYLKSINSFDILNDPDRILNGDETSFSLCPKSSKVIAPVCHKNVYTLNMRNEKETLTVLIVCSASGKTIPPMVVFPYKRTPKDIVKSIPDGWFLGKSDTGWMSSENFHEYIENGVNKWISDQSISKPVILFVDTHKCHLTMQLSEFCSNNGIILYALPPSTTHIMKPVDSSVFKPLKKNWKKTVSEWSNLPENNNTLITKISICPVIKMVLDKISLPDSIKHEFKRCGLFPFDCNAVDYKKCTQNERENDIGASVECVSLPNISDEAVNTTVFVLNKLRNNLQNKGINVDEVIEVIKSARTNTPDDYWHSFAVEFVNEN